MAHLKSILGTVSGELVDVDIDLKLIKELGVVNDTKNGQPAELIDLLISREISFVIFGKGVFEEEIAKKEFLGEGVAKLIEVKEIDIEKAKENVIVFSRKDFPLGKSKLVKVIAGCPYTAINILKKFYPSHKFVVIESGEELESMGEEKKIVAVVVSQIEGVDEVRAGKYNIGVNIRFHGENYQGLRIIDEIKYSSIVVASLKGNKKLDSLVATVKSILEAKKRYRLKARILKEKELEVKNIFSPVPVQFFNSNGSDQYMGIEVVILKKDLSTLQKKLKDIGAEQTTTEDIKTFYE